MAIFDIDTPTGFSGGPMLDRRTGKALGMVSAGKALGMVSAGNARETWVVPTAHILEDISRQVSGMPADARPAIRSWLESVK